MLYLQSKNVNLNDCLFLNNNNYHHHHHNNNNNNNNSNNNNMTIFIQRLFNKALKHFTNEYRILTVEDLR